MVDLKDRAVDFMEFERLVKSIAGWEQIESHLPSSREAMEQHTTLLRCLQEDKAKLEIVRSRMEKHLEIDELNYTKWRKES
jgi:hypothetical protein